MPSQSEALGKAGVVDAAAARGARYTPADDGPIADAGTPLEAWGGLVAPLGEVLHPAQCSIKPGDDGAVAEWSSVD